MGVGVGRGRVFWAWAWVAFFILFLCSNVFVLLVCKLKSNCHIAAVLSINVPYHKFTPTQTLYQNIIGFIAKNDQLGLISLTIHLRLFEALTN